jgi:Ca2+-binding EF-hand superfamily protein
MLTQDYEPIPREKAINFIPIEIIKKMGQEAAEQEFQEKKRKKEEIKRMAEKYKQKLKEQNDKEGSYEEEKRSSFWLNNINTGDIYRSFIKGTNPWAKSSGFTQLLQNTRGAFQYYQNAKDSPLDPNYVKAIEEDRKMREEFLRKEQEEKERLAKIDEEIKKKNKSLNSNTLNNVMPQIEGQEIPTKVSDETIDKILKGCSIRGWIGLRSLKCYLRNLSAHKSEIINKNDFKYHLAKQAILLNDNDVDTIFAVYDKSKSDYINYITFLNSISRVNETRKAQIESFKEQVKVPGQNYIYFSNLISLANMNYHPEAIKFLKTVPDLSEEYSINWDNLKEDNRVTENDFKQFFYDISSCVQNDEDFTQILKSLGYK